VLTLVLYIRPHWFREASRQPSDIVRFGRTGIEVADHLMIAVHDTARRLATFGHNDGGIEDRMSMLMRAAFDQSWRWSGLVETQPAGGDGPRDFRIRRALALLNNRLGEPVDLALISREAGLSRPHFFKLFREQMGLPPTIYLNALRMERAIDRLAQGLETVADIGLDLGFSTPASFSRFFIANGVVPPSAYRRSVLAPCAH
jgi:AraC-like DNA-binding protein